MKNVFISHNPYKVISIVQVEGENVAHNSKFTKHLKERFQLWVDKIPELLAEECNDDEYEITFHGTELDYQDLLAATQTAAIKESSLKFRLKKIAAKDFGEKEQDIRKLFERTQQLPFDELRSPTMTAAFNKAFDDEFEVNVVATMSAGKSTLINALLRRKLMPSKQGACTATITKIKDDDDGTFKAVAVDAEGSELGSFSNLDYKTMSDLNKNPSVSEICVKGDIPFVKSDEISLILIDTPGPDNARDKRHGLVTAKALDESSKMLVLFVMNGGKLHDEAQDLFLRKIAKSMSVGGKQSRERFMFVINKLDAYDEEDDDIAGETIPDTVRYLEEMGIENPNIFPAAAYPALLIRRYQNTHDEDEKQKILRELEPLAHKLIDQQQLHLETYAQLSYSSQDKIMHELEAAMENGDIIGEALIHTGIRGIEETINTYVTKYCRPAKITNVVEKFRTGLESAAAFENTRKEIASQMKEQEKQASMIVELEKKLTSRTENEAFKKKIAALNITTELEHEVNALAADFEDPLTAVFKNCDAELEEDEAEDLIRKFKRLAENKQNEFQVAVDRLLRKDIKDKGDMLLTEYVNRLTALSQEFKAKKLNINLASLAKGTLANLDVFDALDQSIDSRFETHSERRIRTVSKKRKWYSPMRIFRGDYYDVEKAYYVDIKEEIRFVSRDKLSNTLVAPIRKGLVEERKRISAFAKEKSEELKQEFYAKFDEVDQILAAKTKELHQATASKEAAAEALNRANILLEQLEAVKKELEDILEI